MNPSRRPSLLENGRDIGVDDDITHRRSRKSCVARCPKIGEERIELLVRLPDLVDEVVRIIDHLRAL